MPWIYAGGNMRWVPTTAQAQASGNPAIVQNNASGSSPAAVAAMTENARPTPVAAPTAPTGPVTPVTPVTPTADPVKPAYDRAPAKNILAALLAQMGLDGLIGDVDQFIVDNGANDTFTLAERIRNNAVYKDRFAGLVNLRNKGITDVANEADYLRLEKEYRQVFRDAGIQSYIGEAGSKVERDAIAKLVGDYVISVNEVRSRIQDAQRVVNDTAPEVKDALQRYYNISPADMVAYTLDPSRTKDRINDIANSAIIGGYAGRAGLNADLGTAERIAGLSQGNDVSLQNLTTQMTTARAVKDATARLANIESTDLTDSEILGSEYSIDPESQRKIKTLQSRERARFSGQSGMGKDTLTRGTGV